MGLYGELRRRLAAGAPVALATVIGSRGSVPRRVGTKMLVQADGQQSGTVGGGCGEAEVWRAALDVVRDGGSRRIQVDLLGDPVLATDAVCGGIMELYVDRWEPADAGLAAAADGELPAAVVTVISGDGPTPAGARLVVTAAATHGAWADGTAQEWAGTAARAVLAAGRPALVRQGALTAFIDLETPLPWLLIAGAGHIGRALAALAAPLGFRVAVLDDRPEYADRRYFPAADRVLAMDFTAGLAEVPLDAQTFVVIVTRGHRHDYQVLTALIDRPVAYLGMIGSRRRVTTVFNLLHAAGIDAERTRRVHAPIGLEIGAETPAEIAISILAQIIAVRRGVR